MPPPLACDFTLFPTQGSLCASGDSPLSQGSLSSAFQFGLDEQEASGGDQKPSERVRGICSTHSPWVLRTPSQACGGNSFLLLLQLPQYFLSHPCRWSLNHLSCLSVSCSGLTKSPNVHLRLPLLGLLGRKASGFSVGQTGPRFPKPISAGQDSGQVPDVILASVCLELQLGGSADFPLPPLQDVRFNYRFSLNWRAKDLPIPCSEAMV